MRHRKAGKQLSRNTSHRRAMLRNITTSLLKHERIETTDAKAKSVRPIAEKMITLAKRGDLHARRQALAYIQDKVVTHKLFDELKDRYADRQGGYVRIIKKGVRKGDGAPVSIVQLVLKDEEPKAEKKKAKKRKATQAASPAKKGSAVKTDEKKQPETAPETKNEAAVEETKADAEVKTEAEPESIDASETESAEKTEDKEEKE